MTSWLFDGLAPQLMNTPLHPANTSQAAVLILISRGDNPAILFTKRSAHLRQHPGEVCFPGGMWEFGDENLLATAQREVYEEIGLPARHFQLLGCLPPFHTRAGTAVTPFVAHFDESIPLCASPDELESIFMVPIATFRSGLQVREDCFEQQGKRWRVPVYHYQNYEIWGLTAAVTAQLLLLIDHVHP